MKTVKYNLKIQIINVLLENKLLYVICHNSANKNSNYLSKSALNCYKLKKLFTYSIKFPLFLRPFNSLATNLFSYAIVSQIYNLMIFQSCHIVNYINLNINGGFLKLFGFLKSLFYIFFKLVLQKLFI